MASLTVRESAPPSMQHIPLREDEPFLKFLRFKIIFPTTTLPHDQKVKKILNSIGAFGEQLIKKTTADNYDKPQ